MNIYSIFVTTLQIKVLICALTLTLQSDFFITFTDKTKFVCFTPYYLYCWWLLRCVLIHEYIYIYIWREEKLSMNSHEKSFQKQSHTPPLLSVVNCVSGRFTISCMIEENQAWTKGQNALDTAFTRTSTFFQINENYIFNPS